MAGETVSATTIMDAPAEAVFAVLADPARHAGVFHSPWWMITPYSVLATSVGISLFLSLIGSSHANRARPN